MLLRSGRRCTLCWDTWVRRNKHRHATHTHQMVLLIENDGTIRMPHVVCYAVFVKRQSYRSCIVGPYKAVRIVLRKRWKNCQSLTACSCGWSAGELKWSKTWSSQQHGRTYTHAAHALQSNKIHRRSKRKQQCVQYSWTLVVYYNIIHVMYICNSVASYLVTGYDISPKLNK